MPTVLQILSDGFPAIDTQTVQPGPNTISDENHQPDRWAIWTEFNFDMLKTIFSEQLGQPYRGGLNAIPDHLPLDLRVCNEATMQLVLDRFVIPAVNHCLSGQQGGCHYGPGVRCEDGDFKPDWSCVAHNIYNLNVLPGDTKLSKKWVPTMATSAELYQQEEWAKVLGQIIGYMKNWNSRYGFIITDKHLVVLRITRLQIGEGLATGREPRATSTSVPQDNQDLSYVESSFANTTLSYADDDLSNLESSFANTTLSYADDNPLNWEICDPEYAIIPTNRHGRGKLTVKLALWCLAMMAANGPRHIDYWYPGINTWRREGREYVHNTTGERSRHRGNRNVI